MSSAHKNYETQIIKVQKICKIYMKRKNVQCKEICVKCKIREAQNVKMQNMYNT